MKNPFQSPNPRGPLLEGYMVKFPDKVSGPFSFDQMRRLISRGRVNQETQISQDEIEWRPAAEYSEFDFDAYIADLSPPVVCPHCSFRVTSTTVVCPKCNKELFEPIPEKAIVLSPIKFCALMAFLMLAALIILFRWWLFSQV